jgi:hypothetical protein
MRHPFRLLTVALCALAVCSVAFAQAGPPGGKIYAHNMLFKTVGTPTSLPEHGKFDLIYVLGNGLANVANAAPGDMEFNGGRWEVHPITWVTIDPMQFTNAEDLEAAAAAGQISIGPVVKRFECPMIPAR